MYFCYDAYTFYTLHVSNAYFPKVCVKYTPTGRITPRPSRHHWASSMGSFPFVPPRRNQRGATRSFQNCPSFRRAPVDTLTRGSVCLTVGEKKKKYFVLSIEVGEMSQGTAVTCHYPLRRRRRLMQYTYTRLFTRKFHGLFAFYPFRLSHTGILFWGKTLMEQTISPSTCMA